MDEGRVAGERRPGFNFMMELFASPRELFNGSLAAGDGCKRDVDSCADTTREENTCCRSSRGRVRIGDDILHSQLSSPLFAK